MADSSNRIGGSASGATRDFTAVSQTAEGAAARASTTAARGDSGSPGGGKGRVERVLNGDLSPSNFNRTAPRGTYLNILV